MFQSIKQQSSISFPSVNTDKELTYQKSHILINNPEKFKDYSKIYIYMHVRIFKRLDIWNWQEYTTSFYKGFCWTN